MSYVHPPQFVNSTADILQVLNPFLTPLTINNHGKYKAKDLGILFEAAQEEIKNPRHQGVFEKDILYHTQVKDLLNGLRSSYEHFIFTTGVSTNLSSSTSGIPKRIATDAFTDQFSLTTKIIEKANDSPEIYDKVLFIPVAPIIHPFFYNNQGINHPFKDVIYEINQSMIQKNKRGFGDVEKNLTTSGNIPNSEFYEGSFNLEKRLDQLRKSPKEHLSQRDYDSLSYKLGTEVILNNLLMTNAFSNILELMNIPVANLFAMQTSYSRPILIQAASDSKTKFHSIGGPSGCMRNTEESPYGETDRSALNILSGFLLSSYSHKRKIFSKPILKKSKKEEGFIIEPLSCPFNPFLLCPFQKKANTIDDCCSSSFIASQDSSAIELLRTQTRDMHFGIKGIETILLELMSGKDYDVVDSSKKHYSWKKEVEGKKMILLPKFDVPEEFEIRSSGFYSAGPISRFIGKYSGIFPFKPEMNEFAKLGVLMHTLMFSQPDSSYKHNELLKIIGLPETRRQEYCERPILYNHNGIRVHGHFDSSILLEDSQGSKDIVVLDAKRSRKMPYAKIGYRHQLLSYALGIKSSLEINPNNYYLILINRPFEEDLGFSPSPIQGLHKSQEYTIIKVPNDDELIDQLNSRIEVINKEDQILLEDSKYFSHSLKEEESFFEKFEDARAYKNYLISELDHHKNLKEYLESMGVGKL